MPNTVAQLKLAVAGFMQRDPAVFVRGSFDLLLQACNNARLYAERKVDFELAHVAVDLPHTDPLNGVDLSAAVLHGTATAVRVKKIISPFLANTDGGQFPVDLWTKRRWNDKLKRRFERGHHHMHSGTPQKHFVESPFVVVQDGTTLFVVPVDSKMFSAPFTIYLDAIRWLPPYVTGSENDFLLDNCFDWLMFYSISQMNFFLKEDERVVMSESVLKDTWDALVKWNTELLQTATDDVDLD